MSLIKSVNPATGQLVREFVPLYREEINHYLKRAADAFISFRQTRFSDRSRWLHNVAQVLENRAEEFGKLMTIEMGKPFHSAVEEIRKCAWNCYYYSEQGAKFLEQEHVDASPSTGFVRYDPLGPILAIMPWNFPFWQVFRFAAPALMAGNVVLLKHASNVPQCALQIETIFKESGFPQDVFQTLLVGSGQVSAIIEDERIAAVTLTGSVAAGSSVAQVCGKAIKKAVLELGGSDPFIVMPSADLDRAVQVAVEARILNSGQSCVAAKRFIIADLIADEFERRVVQLMRALAVGDPMDPKTHIGPLATEEILVQLDHQVKKSIEMGAKLLLGGRRLNQPGYYYTPTVLAQIPKGSPAYKEELFGPVASIFRVKDTREAIALANDSQFGLGASVWTQEEHERSLFVREIQAGSVFVNQKVASDPRLPFGGIKRSGYGRELGIWGIREFVNVKTISIFPKLKTAEPTPGQPDSSELE